MKDNIDLTEIISKEKSNWKDKAKYRLTNKSWLDKSASIALKILKHLKENNINQKQLAEMIEVSPQYVNKILKGNENLSLETIAKIESALNINLIEISSFDNTIDKIQAKIVYEASNKEQFVSVN